MQKCCNVKIMNGCVYKLIVPLLRQVQRYWIQKVQGSVQSLSHHVDSPLLAFVAHWTPNIRSTKMLSEITWLRCILKQEVLLCIFCKKMVGM